MNSEALIDSFFATYLTDTIQECVTTSLPLHNQFNFMQLLY